MDLLSKMIIIQNMCYGLVLMSTRVQTHTQYLFTGALCKIYNDNYKFKIFVRYISKIII
jgi:hypothetical protein